MSRTTKKPKESSPNYRFTPSLLNKFSDLMNCGELWESFYGSQEEPQFTAEEYEAKIENELIDAINRVPFISEAASRGTALNEIIDCIIQRRKQREDMKVQRMTIKEDGVDKLIGLQAELDGFTFQFDIELVNQLKDYFEDCICQFRCESTIGTNFGPVILYGDPDYIRMDVVYDLKTTSNYSFGKFENGWQKHLYPYCLIESGLLKEVSEFEYTVVLLSGGNSKNPLISGTIYRERYDYHHDETKAKLRGISEAFIAWIEQHREQITNKRIFNQE